ncbi:O-antigen ligase family protein [Rhodothermus marinus]|uniref:O-antigen ligase family protein n=1 Tax=Rhodothermus marinus TaxID=29549 RepID=UPI0037CCB3D1
MPEGLEKILLRFWTICLTGYAFLGKGFAYIGIPPIFVDAFLWGMAFLYLLFHLDFLLILRDWNLTLLSCFMIIGILRTVPYLSIYKIDALRDGVIWGYGLFAIVMAYIIWKYPVDVIAVQWFSKWMMWFPIWAPFALFAYWVFGKSMPQIPWASGIPVIFLKGGDVAVHLIGTLGFWLLFQSYWPVSGLRARLFWAGWLIAFVFSIVIVRAAFVTVTLVAAFLVFFVSPVRWIKVTATVVFFVMIFAIFRINIDVGRERTISFNQLVTNVTSIFSSTENFSGEHSKKWRLNWWKKIVDYTFNGPYFWTGKGFGINLADDDGFQVLKNKALRSPHNGHLTILARSGVPGFFIWVSFLILFFIRIYKSYRRWKNNGSILDARLRLWVMAYVLAAIVNTGFDVYMEGPQGGVWLWTLLGFGLGLLLRDQALAYAHSDGTYVLSAVRG